MNDGVIKFNDSNYPALLKQIHDPPHILYCRGILNPQLTKFTLAVVGSRKHSPYGHQVIRKLVSELSKLGITIVSGLAFGLDALAHQTALDYHGKTIAVLGSGLDDYNIYPSENLQLAHQIIANNGCLISEYAPGTGAQKYHFPMRNRIISGMSLGTLVIEAAERSGSLITARYALEQNREVMAIPGRIDSSTSKGTNNLIKMGARPVTSIDDILETLNLTIN
ncbi:MAG: DNA-processing protein DprA [bacterium]